VDENVIADRLTTSGMGRTEALRKGRWFTQALASLDAHGGSSAGDTYLVFVPGRIEVLGKHTDYAGGRSLLAAVERGFSIAARARSDGRLRITDAASGEEANFALEAGLVPAAGHWSNYPMTVARRVARNFPGPLCGADIAFASDLPPAAGMSSSSALITGMFKVLSKVNRLADREEYRTDLRSNEALAAYLATIENGQSFGSLAGDRGVGTFGGSEDHTAICCCRPGVLHEYAFCPVRFQQAIALPAGYVFALGASGVLAEKTGEAMAKYNRASRLVAALLELWQTGTGRCDRCLADAVHSAADAADRLRRIVAERPHADFDRSALLNRLEQFLDENERIIPAAVGALGQGAMGVFGALVDQSQQGAERLLENQVPQTIGLARSARRCGAEAASAFGAGFGGSVWALVKAPSAADFLADWADRYHREFPAEAERSHFFLSGAGPGLSEISDETMERKMWEKKI
jgi:galactokinase